MEWCLAMTKTADLPPLRQSVYEDMACPHLYSAKHVQGIDQAASPEAARGIEVHETFAEYITHLVKQRLPKDLEFFEKLMKNVSADAREVLERFEHHHEFDPERIVGTEVEIALDENLEPLDMGDTSAYRNPTTDTARVAYLGRLDLVQLHSSTEAEIDDWKSYYQIPETADSTFQSKFYPLLLFCLNPRLRKVSFILEFVRYGVSRRVEYTRRDVPQLRELAQQARRRQRQMHTLALRSGSEMQASSGRHCTWCPLLLKGCPLESRNPYAIRAPEELLKHLLWLRQADQKITEVLKDWVGEHGSLRYRDGNEVEYEAGFSLAAKTQYPCAETAAIVLHWINSHPEDQAMAENLTISGLSALLRAKKRQPLAQQLAAIARTRLETRFRLCRKSNGQGVQEFASPDAD
jgi:hypothetical protein